MRKLLFFLLFASLQLCAADLDKASRGFINNNPLNIRFSPRNHWQGQTGSDGAFCRFDSAKNGFRAAFITIHSYMVVHGLDTVEKIITWWAPPCQNDTEDYIRFVSRKMGRNKDARLRFVATDLCPLVAAMARVECGMIYDDAIIREAFEAAKAYVDHR